MMLTELECPKCRNKLYRRRIPIEKHFFKPTVLREELTCQVCGWKKVSKVSVSLSGKVTRIEE